MSTQPSGLANVKHCFLGADSVALWKTIEQMIAAEWDYLKSQKDNGQSLAQLMTHHLTAHSANQSRYLGVGTHWNSNRLLTIATSHGIMNKAGGCRDGGFIILVPAFERVMHGFEDMTPATQITHYECPKVVMITKVKGHPIPASSTERDRIIKNVGEYPASATHFDPSSLASLHSLSLQLEVQKYVSFLAETDALPAGANGPCGVYHVDSWNYDPMAWMALRVDEATLGALLNADPSPSAPSGSQQASSSYAFGRLATSDIVLPKLPQCAAAPEPELFFDPSHLLRSRVGVLGASGSGKSNLIKNLLMALKGPKSPWYGAIKKEAMLSGSSSIPSPKKSTVGLLLLDPQGEYAESNRQGEALADLINPKKGQPTAHVYSFDEPVSALVASKKHHKLLKINFYLEPSKALQLARELPGGESTYLKAAFSTTIANPLDLLKQFIKRSLQKAPMAQELALTLFDRWMTPSSEIFSKQEYRNLVYSLHSENPILTQALIDHWQSSKDLFDSNPSRFASIALDTILSHAFDSSKNPFFTPLTPQEKQFFLQQWQLILLWWCILQSAGYSCESKLLSSHMWDVWCQSLGIPLFSFAFLAPPFNMPKNAHHDIDEQAFKINFEAHLQTLNHLFQPTSFKSSMSDAIKILKNLGIHSPSPDLKNLAYFLMPSDNRNGPSILSQLRSFHATGFVDAESQLVDFVISGHTCIVNLMNSDNHSSPHIKRQFAERICEKLFQKLQAKFANSDQEADEDFNVVLAIEEAQDVLSARDEGKDTIFKKIALQGRKLGLGILFATQSPSNIDQNLYKECNMIFCMNLKSTKEIGYLKDQQSDFQSVSEKLALWQKQGLGHWWRADALTLPFQAYPFPAPSIYTPRPQSNASTAPSPSSSE